jgi:hypothetical protein
MTTTFKAGHCRADRHDYCGGSEEDRHDGTRNDCACRCHAQARKLELLGLASRDLGRINA